MELKGNDDPSTLRVQRTAHERLIPEPFQDSPHVVLHVLLVIGQVWISPAGRWSEENLQTLSVSAGPQSRLDRSLRIVLLKQRPLEFADEDLPKTPHHLEHPLPVTDVLSDDWRSKLDCDDESDPKDEG